jgi:hypothetical protein
MDRFDWSEQSSMKKPANKEILLEEIIQLHGEFSEEAVKTVCTEV